MKILAADTTTAYNAVALCEIDNDATDSPCTILAASNAQCGRRHAERLLPTVEWVLGEAGCRLAEIDLLAISNGPGSFTGLRIGVATWKGLAFANGLPLVAVPTLDALSLNARVRDGVVCTLLDARIDEVFGAVYDFDNGVRTRRSGPSVVPIATAVKDLNGSVTFLGDGAELYADAISTGVPAATFVSGAIGVPSGVSVAQEAARLVLDQEPTQPELVVPVYLRKSQAEVALETTQTETAG